MNPRFLLTALQIKDEVIFAYLIQQGANLYKKILLESNQITPLQLLSDNIQLYRIANITEVNKKDELGNTLLHFAVCNLNIQNKLELTRDLLTKNADPLVTDAEGKTPLMLFVMNNSLKYRSFSGYDSVITQLAPSIHMQDINGNSALHLVHIGEIKLINILIEKGADVLSKNKKSESFLLNFVRSFVKKEEKKEIIELCRSKGYLNKISSDDPELLYRLLHYAIDNDDLSLFKSLLSTAKKDVINFDINGLPSLIEKATNKHKGFVEFLEKKGVEVHSAIAEPVAIRPKQ